MTFNSSNAMASVNIIEFSNAMALIFIGRHHNSADHAAVSNIVAMTPPEQDCLLGYEIHNL